jgi:sodium-dependent phosphate transporter
VYAKVIVKDHSVKWYHVPLGPLLYRRAAPAEDDRAAVPNYAVVQDDEEDHQRPSTRTSAESISGDHSEKTAAKDTERSVVTREASQATYKELVDQAQERLHQKIMKGRGPLAWALRYLRANPMGAGELYEPKNIMIVLKRIPAQIVVGALYGVHYDIHAAQTGISGTPEGARMARVYAHAEKYPNEVEHTYSFVQVLTACTASFAHGANDIGNSVGPWAVIYSAWSSGSAAKAKAPVPIWQLAVLSAAISVGLITYGYNIMKGMTSILPLR